MSNYWPPNNGAFIRFSEPVTTNTSTASAVKIEDLKKVADMFKDMPPVLTRVHANALAYGNVRRAADAVQKREDIPDTVLGFGIPIELDQTLTDGFPQMPVVALEMSDDTVTLLSGHRLENKETMTCKHYEESMERLRWLMKRHSDLTKEQSRRQ